MDTNVVDTNANSIQKVEGTIRRVWLDNGTEKFDGNELRLWRASDG
jgi:hypothetical protein